MAAITLAKWKMYQAFSPTVFHVNPPINPGDENIMLYKDGLKATDEALADTFRELGHLLDTMFGVSEQTKTVRGVFNFLKDYVEEQKLAKEREALQLEQRQTLEERINFLSPNLGLHQLIINGLKKTEGIFKNFGEIENLVKRKQCGIMLTQGRWYDSRWNFFDGKVKDGDIERLFYYSWEHGWFENNARKSEGDTNRARVNILGVFNRFIERGIFSKKEFEDACAPGQRIILIKTTPKMGHHTWSLTKTNDQDFRHFNPERMVQLVDGGFNSNITEQDKKNKMDLFRPVGVVYADGSLHKDYAIDEYRMKRLIHKLMMDPRTEDLVKVLRKIAPYGKVFDEVEKGNIFTEEDKVLENKIRRISRMSPYGSLFTRGV